jgi:two-component system alkaline phosphatase synthesis response regulator PhoP
MDNKKILIVDDENDLLSVLAKSLAGKEYTVITANNGKDAVLLAKSKKPDLIILDVLMPDMDGSEVAMQLKENPATKDIPVIYLTCLYTKEEEHEKGFGVGNNIVLAKPYDIEELVAGIEKVL